MATPHDFYQELASITKFEIVGAPKESDRQLRIVGRVRARDVSRIWATQYAAALVRASTGNTRWSVDLSRYYFEKGNEVLWAWRVIVQTSTVPMGTALDEILRVLRLCGRPAVQAPVEVVEMPLIGVSPARNTVVNGKGASAIRERT